MLIKFILLVSISLVIAKKFPASTDEFIRETNEKATTWTAGRNFHPSLTSKYFRVLMGVLPDADEYRPDEIYHEDLGTIPDDYDAREAHPECPIIQEIRDQGYCGSCWAVSAVSTMSDRICLATNGTKTIRLSENHLIGCCHICGFGCHGGIPYMAWFYYKYRGIVSGGAYGSHQGCQSYTIPPCAHHVDETADLPACTKRVSYPSCIKHCTPEYKVPFKKDKEFAMATYSVQKIDRQIQLEVFHNGPVQASMIVYEDLLNYKSGVYQHVHGSVSGRHAVKIIGWGVENGTDYWLVVNSWNKAWVSFF